MIPLQENSDDETGSRGDRVRVRGSETRVRTSGSGGLRGDMRKVPQSSAWILFGGFRNGVS